VVLCKRGSSQRWLGSHLLVSTRPVSSLTRDAFRAANDTLLGSAALRGEVILMELSPTNALRPILKYFLIRRPKEGQTKTHRGA